MDETPEYVKARPLTEKQIEEARRVIANQRSTMPEDGNIGPEGAWRRASPVDILGHRLKMDRA